MDRLDMAKIFAEQQAEPKETATTTTVTALATSDSTDGTVYIDMGGVTISGDDSQSVPIATTVAVKKGDTVRVELLGADGKAKTPTVTGVIGGGDRVQKAVDEAGETAQQASQTAEQAGQKAEQAATDATDAKESADQAKQASSDAKKTADQAKEEAKKMKNLIRETADGLALGKSADGKTYETAYVELDANGAYKIKTKDGTTLMELSGTSLNFNADKIKIGKTGGSLLSMGNSSDYIDDEHKTAVDAIVESPGTVGMVSNYVDHMCAFLIGPDQNADFLAKRLIIQDPSDSDVKAQGSVADWSAALSAGQYMPHVKEKLEKLLSSKPVVLWDHVGRSQDEVRQNAAVYRARSYVDSNWHMERFERILIEYADDDGTMQSITVTGPFLGQRIALMTGVSLPGTMWIKTKHFTIHNDGLREAKIRDIFAFGDASLPDHGSIGITQGNPIAILRITGYPSI